MNGTRIYSDVLDFEKISIGGSIFHSIKSPIKGFFNDFRG